MCAHAVTCVNVDLLQSLCFRIQKMLEAYRPDWCETRDDWSVFLFSPQNKLVPVIPLPVFLFIISFTQRI